MLWIVGGVFIFNLLFTRFMIKKWSFTARLTCFMGAISLYECLGFYWFGFFEGKGSIIQWGTFVGIILALYFVCIMIYQRYSKSQGEIYTKKLHKYQAERSVQHGK